jgi:hypothetical protein
MRKMRIEEGRRRISRTLEKDEEEQKGDGRRARKNKKTIGER